MLVKALVLLFAVAVVSCSNSPDTRAPVDVSLCDVSLSPERYDGRQVDVAAWVEGAPHHVELVFDPKCEQSAYRLAIPQESEGSAEVVALRREIWRGYPDDMRAVPVRLRCPFRYQPDKVVLRVLILDEILAVKQGASS